MDLTKGSICYADTTRKGAAKILINGSALTKAKVATLATGIASHTNCTQYLVTLLDETRITKTFAGIRDRKAVLTCQEPSGTIHKWEIPDPVAADCEILKGGNGQRLTAAAADALCALFATATGLTLVALDCPIIQRT